MVSAIKIDGRRLHELARQRRRGRSPAAAGADRPLHASSRSPTARIPEAGVVVDCSSGTYVRSLAADLGVALGGCAHLRDLRRLRVGPFDIADARPLEQIEADPATAVLTPADAMRALPRVDRRRARKRGR